MMFSAIGQIKTRRSVRTFDGQILNECIKEKLRSGMEDIKNPFDIPVEIKFLDAKENVHSRKYNEKGSQSRRKITF